MKTFKLLALLAFCLAAQKVVNLIWLWACVFRQDRAWFMFVSYDRHCNAAANGDPRETISSRAYYGMITGGVGWCILCKLLDRFQQRHCELSKDV